MMLTKMGVQRPYALPQQKTQLVNRHKSSATGGDSVSFSSHHPAPTLQFGMNKATLPLAVLLFLASSCGPEGTRKLFDPVRTLKPGKKQRTLSYRQFVKAVNQACFSNPPVTSSTSKHDKKKRIDRSTARREINAAVYDVLKESGIDSLKQITWSSDGVSARSADDDGFVFVRFDLNNGNLDPDKEVIARAFKKGKTWTAKTGNSMCDSRIFTTDPAGNTTPKKLAHPTSRITKQPSKKQRAKAVGNKRLPANKQNK